MSARTVTIYDGSKTTILDPSHPYDVSVYGSNDMTAVLNNSQISFQSDGWNDGGYPFDQLNLYGSDNVVTGGPGFNVDNVHGNFNFLDLGGVVNVASVTGSFNTVFGGWDYNNFSVSGYGNTILTEGWSNHALLQGVGNSYYDFNQFGDDSVGVVGSNNFMSLGAGSNTADINGNANTTIADGGVFVLNGESNRVINFGGDSITFLRSGADDTHLFAAGGDMLVLAAPGSGSLDVTAFGGANVTIVDLTPGAYNLDLLASAFQPTSSHDGGDLMGPFIRYDNHSAVVPGTSDWTQMVAKG